MGNGLNDPVQRRGFACIGAGITGIWWTPLGIDGRS
jgi:hypothetical protein